MRQTNCPRATATETSIGSYDWPDKCGRNEDTYMFLFPGTVFLRLVKQIEWSIKVWSSFNTIDRPFVILVDLRLPSSCGSSPGVYSTKSLTLKVLWNGKFRWVPSPKYQYVIWGSHIEQTPWLYNWKRYDLLVTSLQTPGTWHVADIIFPPHHSSYQKQSSAQRYPTAPASAQYPTNYIHDEAKELTWRLGSHVNMGNSANRPLLEVFLMSLSYKSRNLISCWRPLLLYINLICVEVPENTHEACTFRRNWKIYHRKGIRSVIYS